MRLRVCAAHGVCLFVCAVCVLDLLCALWACLVVLCSRVCVVCACVFLGVLFA